MKKTLFDYTNYKLYLNEKILSFPAKGRGLKLQMAKFLGCQTAYVSQVLNKETHFSLEQAVKLNDFWKHNREESRFFLLLVQYARAGSYQLEQFIKSEMEEIIEKRSHLKERVNIKDSLDEENMHTYYSTWYYAAIHILLSIPEFQSADSIAQKLQLPLKKVQEVLDFLLETGLARMEGNKYVIGLTRIFLDKGSIPIRRHHANWRVQSLNAIDRYDPEDLHFSGVFSLSQKDVPEVKEILLKAVDEIRSIVRDSKEEGIQVVNIDLFGL